MKEVKMVTWVQGLFTLGIMSFQDLNLFTLELPWKDNAKSVSCIPHGVYDVEFYQSPSRGLLVPMLKDVPGRSYVQIHPGNYTRQIEGCILVGEAVKFLDQDAIPDVANSRSAFNKLVGRLDNKPFRLRIQRQGDYVDFSRMEVSRELS